MKEIYLYGEIGYEVTAKQVILDLKEYDPKEVAIQIRLHSPGGAVYEGDAIMNALKRDGRPLHFYVDGLCASMATMLLTEASYVEACENATFMFHNPNMGAYGDGDDMEQAAKRLKEMTDRFIAKYSEKTGKDSEEIRKLMKAETWMTAEEALEFGIIDHIAEALPEKQKMVAKFDFSNFSTKKPGSTGTTTNKKEAKMKAKLTTMLNLDDGATDETVLARIKDLGKKAGELEAKAQLITDLKAKVEAKETELAELQAKVTDADSKLSAFESEKIVAKVQTETGYIVASENIEALQRRAQRYTVESDADMKTDMFEDMKAFCIAKGVKEGSDPKLEGAHRTETPSADALDKKIKATMNEKGISYSEAFDIVAKLEKNITIGE